MALFKTTDEFRQYKTIDINTRFETLLPFIENAEEEFIKDLIGDSLYEALNEDYQTNSLAGGHNEAMDPDLLALLPYVQRPLANYAFYYGFTDLSAYIGEGGVQVATGQNMIPAPKWMQDKMLVKALRDADMQADRLLAFLEENKYAPVLEWSATTTYAANGIAMQLHRFWKSKAGANLNHQPPTDPVETEDTYWIEEAEEDIVFTYEGFFTSSSNTIAEGMILHNAAVASEYVDINNSRRIFLKMKRFIKTIEDKEIRRLICNEQYTRLTEGIAAGDTTAEEDMLIEKVRPIVAKEALWLTMPTLPVSIEADGIFMYSFSDSTIIKNLASAEMIKNYRTGLREGMASWENDINDLKQFILDNIADYPLIEASACYTSQPNPGPTYKVDNYEDRSHFSV